MRTGAPEPIADFELRLLLDAVDARWGLDLRGYALPSLRRRIARVMERAGVDHPCALIERVLHDGDYFADFLTGLLVSVTSFFRDSECFRHLAEVAIPHLASRAHPRIWHAGCASGEEVYSLAILLREAGLLERATIYGTDCNLTALRTARQGVYPLAAVAERAEAYRAAGGSGSLLDHFVTRNASGEREAMCIVDSRIRERIVWSHHVLGRDPAFTTADLIVCRNTLIYFGRELQDRVIELFCTSLADDGLLAICDNEALTRSPRGGEFESAVRSRVLRRSNLRRAEHASDLEPGVFR